jgi:hypothetical protein
LPAILPVLTGEGAAAASVAARAAAHEALLRIENPTLESAEVVDCASCHIANRLRGFMETTFPAATPPATLYAGAIEARRVIGKAEASNQNIRAFGYFETEPVITQRVANETHAALAAFAALAR